MKELLEGFASQYAAAEDRLTGQGDDQSSIHYPTVYLFIGDKTGEAIEPMMRINERKWDNSAGVMYVHVASDSYRAEPSGLGEGERLTRLLLPLAGDQEDGKTYRRRAYHSFYQEERHLLELNRRLRQVSMSIADYGRLYASFDRIHLSIITRVDDPLNVLIPEISLLAQSIFSQSFKSVQMDLYVLIEERDQVDSFGYTSSIGMAFLRELEYMQQSDYSFSAPLQVTEVGISIPVKHANTPLFDLVYLLSDKDERGITSPIGMQDNYEIISHISLLKNRRQKDVAYDLNVGGYNNTSFKNSLMTESGRQGFVSSGFARVKRPNHTIALAVLYHFFRGLVKRLNMELEWSSNEKLALFGIDAAGISARADEIMPSEEKLADMSGIMTHPVSFSQLRRMSLLEAEEALFGEGCRSYYRENFIRVAEDRIHQLDAESEIKRTLERQLAQHKQVSFYHLYTWTDEFSESDHVMKELHEAVRETQREIELERPELEQLYSLKVDDLSFQRLPLMDKHNVRNFIRAFFNEVYRQKLELLYLDTELKLIRRYEGVLDRLHQRYKQQVLQMKLLEETLKAATVESIRLADDYIGQNIMEYYERVTEQVMQDIESRRGAGAFFEERYMGNMTTLLDKGLDAVVERLIQVCREELLTAEPFRLTFEEELLQRANVTVEYHDRQVLSKDELFKTLYRTLEERAGIHIRLLDYTHEHRYEEKYFFGDNTSEFVRYAVSADETSRIYKLGCVHEKRSSGVEKLNMMGGFHLEDLMFYRNGKVYYEHYVQNGYEFHGLEPDLLPQLR